jgi:hypothetical protein
MKNKFTTCPFSKWNNDTNCIIARVEMSFCATLNVKNKARKGISGRMFVERKNVAKDLDVCILLRQIGCDELVNVSTDVCQNIFESVVG